MKYIIYSVKSGEVTHRIPIIFPNILVHSDVDKRIAHCLRREHGFDAVKAIRAGECQVTAYCSGNSETLGLESGDDDTNLINMIDYGGGVLYD